MNNLPIPQQSLLRRIRVLLGLFMAGLIISGATAIPLGWEMSVLFPHVPPHTDLWRWLTMVQSGLREVDTQYPFLAYGTDWLAFGHFMIALAFVGPWRDPVRNIWVLTFGMIACALVVPYALIFGPLRGIPFGWRLIDCSFGIVGIVPLCICYKYAQEMARLSGDDATSRRR